MPKLQETNRGQFVLTLPKGIVRAKGWSKGCELSLRIDDKGRITIY